jgi:hypothetical protein
MNIKDKILKDNYYSGDGKRQYRSIRMLNNMERNEMKKMKE